MVSVRTGRGDATPKEGGAQRRLDTKKKRKVHNEHSKKTVHSGAESNHTAFAFLVGTY